MYVRWCNHARRVHEELHGGRGCRGGTPHLPHSTHPPLVHNHHLRLRLSCGSGSSSCSLLGARRPGLGRGLGLGRNLGCRRLGGSPCRLLGWGLGSAAGRQRRQRARMGGRETGRQLAQRPPGTASCRAARCGQAQHPPTHLGFVRMAGSLRLRGLGPPASLITETASPPASDALSLAAALAAAAAPAAARAEPTPD